MRLLSAIWQWFRTWLSPAEKHWRAEYVDDTPESIGDSIVYLVQEEGQVWKAVLRCPCGCSAVIQLCCIRTTRPSWRYEDGGVLGISIYPSVWRTTGCKSHFFIRKGLTKWC